MVSDQFPGSFFGPSTLVGLLRHRAEFQTTEDAYVYLVDGESDEQHLTYEQLDRQARAIAAWLQGHGLTGQRALLLYPAGMDFIAAFFGCLYAGVVAVPAYPPRMNRSLGRIESIVDDAQAKVALSLGSVIERVDPMLEETPELRTLEWMATDQVDLNLADDWKMPDISGDTLAFLQYTSGSTGVPKGVMLSHSNLLHNSALIYHVFEHTRSGLGVFWLPSYHDMGLIGGILQPLYAGRPNILMSPVSFLQRPLRWLKAISHYGGTTSGGPNFAYELCLQKVTPEQRDQLDLSSWQVAFNGAEPIRAETLDRFAEYFGPCGFRREAFYPCYGLAEGTLIVSGGQKSEPPVVQTVDGRELENHNVVLCGSDNPNARQMIGCGQNMRDQRIAIVDPETHAELPEGKVGEIWVQGPSIAQGYWQRPGATEATFGAHLADGAGPFLRTGDLGCMLNHELFCTGRLKDLIIVRGVNHYPQDIELTAEKSHEVLRPGHGAACAVELDGRQQLVLVQEIERRQDAHAADAIVAIRKEVTKQHELTLDAVVLIKAGSIPKTSSGKIQRHAAGRAFLDGELTVIASFPTKIPEPKAEAAQETAEKVSKPAVAPAPAKVVPAPSAAVQPATFPIEQTVPQQFAECQRFLEDLEMQQGTALQALANVTLAGPAEAKFATTQGELLNLVGHNYLGLATNPSVIAAAEQALQKYGTALSTTLGSAQHPLRKELEQALATLIGSDDAVVTASATDALDAVRAWFGSQDAVVCALPLESHVRPLAAGGAKLETLASSDLGELEIWLAAQRKDFRRVLVVLEGLGSCDGQLLDLPRLLELKAQHGFVLAVDESHSLGTLGESGRGLAEHFDLDPADVDLWFGSLAHALAGQGAYLAGNKRVVQYVRHHLTGASANPAALAAALAATKLLASDPAPVKKLQENVATLRTALEDAGLPLGDEQLAGPILPVKLGNSMQTMQVTQQLLQSGLLVQGAIPPEVAEGSAAVVLHVSALHTPEQLRPIASQIAQLQAKTSPAAQGSSSLSPASR